MSGGVSEENSTASDPRCLRFFSCSNLHFSLRVAPPDLSIFGNSEKGQTWRRSLRWCRLARSLRRRGRCSLAAHFRINGSRKNADVDTHTATQHTHTYTRGVGVARLGLDVALITVQVEIVRAIDCASKCYTSHLSFFSPTEGQCAIQKKKKKKMLTLTHCDIFQRCLTTCGFTSLKVCLFI